jgi:hypothetical protein
MCDYSLRTVRSRPARVGDKLTTRDFATGTRGFAAPEDANTAVCVLPGTEEVKGGGHGACRENRWFQMSDLYFKAIQEQWPNIRALYMTYGSEKPIILYDINEQKIYA